MQKVDSDVAALEALTRVLVGVAWSSAHAAPAGVTFPQIRLLLVLDALGQVSSSKLAAALGVNASSVTRLADKLAARGYLVRGADPHNRSVVTVEVTGSGRRVVAQVLDRRHAELGALLDRLSTTQRRRAAGAARELVTAAAGAAMVGAAGPGPL
ncbi:MarR family winged helix-turn-helix transcriptional regulator [Amycolatopsis pithecellobii]|uniref:MarR family transcriptional regulator n=1 Tax=Amycolatopsis pithecellobii TaxID=664692 RepID=A0A6N7YVR4_9PSEU|nr:MarR family transcriptional regulator [Amycolatopsis pithecellobii]MTD52963.1 MarR family transcriptional regulator [Amycolatopsis pithecellobii]